MKNKKMLAILMAALMSLSMLAACGDKEPDAPSESKSTESSAPSEEKKDEQPADSQTEENSMYEVTEPVAIDFWYNGSSNGAFYDQIAEEFNSTHENITVTPICIGEYGEIKKQFVAAQAAGTGLPGALLINAPALRVYVDSGALEPLSNYFQAADVDISDYAEGYMNQGKFGDEYYAIPHGASMGVMFYNKDALKEYGYDKFPETWEELKAMSKDIYEQTGKPAVTFDGVSTNTMYNTIMNFGGMLVTDDDTCDLENETVIGYFKELKEMVDAGYMHWDIEGAMISYTMFYNGDTFAIDSTNTGYDEINDGDFEVGMAWPVKAAYGNSSVAGGWICIPSLLDQQQKNAAFQWSAYLTSPEINLRWCEFSHYSVIHTSVFQDDAKMANIYNDFADMKVVYENIGNLKPKAKSTYFDSLEKTFKTHLNQILIEGADFDSTWAAMVEEVKYILAGN